MNHIPVTSPKLNRDKYRDNQPKPNNTPPNPTIPPRIRAPTPLQRQQQAHNPTDQKERPRQVHLQNLLLERQINMLPPRILEEEKHRRERHPSKRQVNPKTPPPRQPVRERPAQQRADNGADAEHGG